MKNIRINSQYIKKGDVFVGISCENIKDNVITAINNGASVIFVEQEHKKLFNGFENVEFINDARLFASKLASVFYDKSPETCVAITGTNGKSSVVHFLRQIWQHSGKKSASLGTLGLCIDDEITKPEGLEVPSLTTPDAVSLHGILNYMSESGVTHFAFEASSHALDQKRLHSVPLKAAGFTNLASDHLDYHKTKECYLSSKLKLFSEILPPANPAVVSLDFPDIYSAVKKVHKNIVTFGFGTSNFIRAKNIQEFSTKIVFDLFFGTDVFENIIVNLFGRFQVMNVLCAIALAHACGIDAKQITENLGRITQLDGRMEHICSFNEGNVYVDYAHTSEGFRNCLETFRRTCKGRLICVFGCGGDRDKTKRQEMGKIASELSDIIIVTDDNPRTEDPVSIRTEIMSGCEGAVEVSNRKEAIKFGMNLLQSGDALVVIGKGHETSQIYREQIIHHNDKEEILKIFKSSIDTNSKI